MPQDPQLNTISLPHKTNWVKQVYFYLIIGFSLAFFAGGFFTFSRSILIRTVFPLADNSYYNYGGGNPKSMCQYGSNMYYQGKNIPSAASTPVDGKMMTSPVITPEEIKTCEEVTEKGIQSEKDRQFQNDMLNSILAMVITFVIGFGHFLIRRVFLHKD